MRKRQIPSNISSKYAVEILELIDVYDRIDFRLIRRVLHYSNVGLVVRYKLRWFVLHDENELLPLLQTQREKGKLAGGGMEPEYFTENYGAKSFVFDWDTPRHIYF